MKTPKCLSSKKVYTCRSFTVKENLLQLPELQRNVYTVEHASSVAIVPVTADGQIILERQYRHAAEKIISEIPAGTMDKGSESPEACAQRELAEEIGFKAKQLIPLFAGYMLPGYCTEYMHFFLALDLYPEKLPGDIDEYIETYTIPLSQIKTHIEKEIIDGKSVIGIMLSLDYLRTKGLVYGQSF
jgi:ADP-ribose pyrophosphatase